MNNNEKNENEDEERLARVYSAHGGFACHWCGMRISYGRKICNHCKGHIKWKIKN